MIHLLPVFTPTDGFRLQCNRQTNYYFSSRRLFKDKKDILPLLKNCFLFDFFLSFVISFIPTFTSWHSLCPSLLVLWCYVTFRYVVNDENWWQPVFFSIDLLTKFSNNDPFSIILTRSVSSVSMSAYQSFEMFVSRSRV